MRRPVVALYRRGGAAAALVHDPAADLGHEADRNNKPGFTWLSGMRRADPGVQVPVADRGGRNVDPGIVWVVVMVGGALTLAASSLLGAWQLRLHLALSALLALSGALNLVMIVSPSHRSAATFG